MVTDHVLAPLRRAVAAYLHPLAERFAQTTGRTGLPGFRVRPAHSPHRDLALPCGQGRYTPSVPPGGAFGWPPPRWPGCGRRSTRRGGRAQRTSTARPFRDWYANSSTTLCRVSAGGSPPSAPRAPRPLLPAPAGPPPECVGPYFAPGSAGPAVRALQQRLNDWLARAPGRTPLRWTAGTARPRNRQWWRTSGRPACPPTASPGPARGPPSTECADCDHRLPLPRRSRRRVPRAMGHRGPHRALPGPSPGGRNRSDMRLPCVQQRLRSGQRPPG